MTAPGSPSPTTISITSPGESSAKTYELALENGRVAYDVVDQGRDLRWERDFRNGSYGFGETVQQTERGDFYSDNMETTKRGLRLGPTITTVALSGGLAVDPFNRPPVFFEAQDASSNRYVYVHANSNGTTACKIHKIKASDDSVTVSDTNTATTTNTPGRPDHFQGNWYICESGNANLVSGIAQLTTVGVSAGAASNDTWTDYSTTTACDVLLLEDTSEGSARLYRTANGNTVQSCTAGNSPVTAASWATTGVVGDSGYSGIIITGGASHAGITIFGKNTDQAYAFDPSGNSYLVNPGLQRGVTPGSQSGFGTFAYGNIVYYNAGGGLKEITEVNRLRDVGPDVIPYYTSAPNITAPIRFTHYEGCFYGEWRYSIYADGTNNNNSYIMAFHGSHPKTGLPLWFPIINRSVRVRGLFIDSARRLWWGEPGNNRVGYVQLALDGSPDGTARGTSGVSGVWRGPEIDATQLGLARSEVTLQLRHLFVETEGTFTNTSWQMEYFRDGGAVANLGSAITSATGTSINPTVGTNDTARRWRFGTTVTVSGSVTAGPNDPKILRTVADFRSPDVIRVIIKPSSDRNQNETLKVLQKLKDAGGIQIREANTNETNSAFIRSVNLVSYRDQGSLHTGIELAYERFVVQA